MGAVPGFCPLPLEGGGRKGVCGMGHYQWGLVSFLAKFLYRAGMRSRTNSPRWSEPGSSSVSTVSTPISGDSSI